MHLNTTKATTFALTVILSVSFSTLFVPLISATENSWDPKAPMQVERSRLGVALVKGKIYDIGGDDVYLSGNCLTAYGCNGKLLNTTEEYDPGSDTWTFKAPMLTPRFSFGVAVYKNKIYLIGGKSEYTTNLNMMEVYDTETDTWTTKTSAPHRITSGASAVADNKIYFLATTSSLDLGAFTQIYNPESAQIQFIVVGETGTTGFCKVTIPKDMLCT